MFYDSAMIVGRIIGQSCVQIKKKMIANKTEFDIVDVEQLLTNEQRKCYILFFHYFYVLHRSKNNF